MPEDLRHMEIFCRELGYILGGAINKEFGGPKKVGFTLFLFDFGEDEDNHITYISNSKREDMIKALEEFLEKLKKEVPQ